MLAQLMLGIYFVITGTIRQFEKEPKIFMNDVIKRNIPAQHLVIHYKKIGRAYIVVGFVIALMGQIEYWYRPSSLVYIVSYIILAILCVFLLLYINKKYSGKYFLR